MEPRRLLSADIDLETLLTSSGTAYAEAEYKVKGGEVSLEFKIYNAVPGDYTAAVGSTSIGTITVPASRIIEFKFSNEPEGLNEALLPNGLQIATGTRLKLTAVSQSGSPEMSGQLGIKGEDPRFATCVKLELLGAAGTVLDTEYEAEQEGTATVRKFELAVRNLAPNSAHTVTIGGVAVGQIQTNILGSGSWMYSDKARPGYSAFPSGFPQIAAGTAITVGTAFSGTYGLAGLTAPVATGGRETLIPLVGTGSIQGSISWETTTLPGGGERREFKAEAWGGVSGASVTVTVQSPGSGPVQIGVIVFNSRGYGRLQFDTADAAKPFPTNFPTLSVNTLFTVGQTLSGAFTDVNQSLVPDDRARREAYLLDQTKDFVLQPSFSENHGKKGEKWLKDKAGKWHFITPDGSLYEWDNRPGANGKRIAILDDSFHTKPELLAQAKAAGSGATNDDLMKATAARLDRELNLTRGSSAANNWGGKSEKWFWGNGKSYFITPDGTLTRWDGSKTATGTPVAKLDDRFHENPSLLSEAEKELTVTEKAFAANTSLNINFYTPTNDNWEGVDVKWVKSATNQWYFVRPNNDMYLWDRRLFVRNKTQKDVGGTFVSNIPGAYLTPAMLTQPPAVLPGTAASRAVLDDLFVDAPDFG